ncbi:MULTISPECIES: erythromycin esterase family protein [Streptomyces]|uniref:Erythromycin esterase family protein n=1 Tax=Streptomyces edwardsiae TaxID=3075527 RepID=A0ABU2Q009_9ACTN|nr:erythromycin esterase family protein [Streptomyces sp. DSM 41636]MDT0397387.1 erythromycin esterase family protein [Streptomyces sp. DSM 41636]
MAPSLTRRLAAALLVWFTVIPGTAAAAPAGGDTGTASDGPVPAAAGVPAALEEAAHPLRTVEPTGGAVEDLRPFGRAVGDAVIVGIGEAAHGSHDFVAFRHRALRYLVEEKGFRSFVLEADWSAGARIDHYLLTGRGDPARIMSEEFQNAFLLLHSQEYLDMFRWMRAYNVAHPNDPVRFAGNDNAYAGPELYDRVMDHVRRAHPDLLPAVTELYQGLRPTVPVGEWIRTAMTAPLDERRGRAARTGRALRLLTAREPAGTDDGDAHALALQHARAVDQVARLYAFDFTDPEAVPRAMTYRDTVMAENTLWWHRRTGHRLVLGGHNSHLYTSSSTPNLPVVEGSVLRRRLGDGYLAVGLSFGRGAVHATEQGLQNPSDDDVRRFEVDSPAPGSVEHTLDRVSHPNWYADLRTTPPGARTWLATAHPKREIGTDYPPPGDQVALLNSVDLVVHLQEIHPSRRLAREPRTPGETTDPLPALEMSAHPLRTVEPTGSVEDLRPLGAALGTARLVGIGQAVHGAHDFLALQHRLFRYLVEEKGFRSFVLEAPYSAGLRLDEHVLTGRGDPARIMAEEFQNAYLFMRTREILDLIRWMRAYNVRHPGDPLRFSGNDSSYAGPDLYDRVVDHVRQAHPGLLASVTELYRGLRPTLPAGEHMVTAFEEPLAVRREKAERTGRVLELLRAPDLDEHSVAMASHVRAVQNAEIVHQVARQNAFDYDDPAGEREALAYRDTVMTENTLWWLRQTGTRAVLAAHNGHVYLEGYDPDYPVIQGSMLRRALGDAYRAVGLSFDHGSFNATDNGVANPRDEDVKLFHTGPPPPGSLEHTLTRVTHANWYTDLRTAPPAARTWLNTPHPKREIGTHWPRPPDQVNLLNSADLLIHIHTIHPAQLPPKDQ